MNGNKDKDSSVTSASLNDSLKGSPMLSPKVGKMDSKEEEQRQYLMKKRSPTKVFEEGKEGNGGTNTSVNYQKNEFARNDRSNRFELLLKNHSNCSTLNQMVLDLLKTDQNRCVYIGYYLFKSIER